MKKIVKLVRLSSKEAFLKLRNLGEKENGDIILISVFINYLE